jgi:hypothetical protein
VRPLDVNPSFIQMSKVAFVFKVQLTYFMFLKGNGLSAVSALSMKGSLCQLSCWASPPARLSFWSEG